MDANRRKVVMEKKHLKRLILVSALVAAAGAGANVRRRFQADLSRSSQRIKHGGKLIETACGPVQYSESGAGAPVLIVHGAGGGYDQGGYFAQLIGGDYRWIAPSRFGFLGQPAPPGADSALQAEVYACLLDSLGIDRVAVVGVSMGGPSALLFAARYPERTTSLVMISAASHAIPPRPALLAVLFNAFLNDFVYWSIVRFSPSALLVALGVPLEVQKQLSTRETAQLHAFLESMEPMGARREGQLLEQRMSEFDSQEIQNIQAPTRVLHAWDDTLVPFEHGESSAASIPGARFIPMQKGGHLALMLDMNAWVREEILEFLEQYNGR